MPTAESLPPTPSAEQCRVADMGMLMDYAGNNPAKLATIVALSTFREGELVTGNELARRLNTLQGDERGWDFLGSSRNVPIEYCRKSLLPAGLVEFGTKTNDEDRTSDVRLTPSGFTDGLTLAGALIPFDFAASEANFVQDAMGSSALGRSRSRTRSEPSRLTIYRHILDSPQSATVAGLRHAASLTQPAARDLLNGLTLIGILITEMRVNPGERNFLLGEPPVNLHKAFKMMRGNVRTLVESVLALRERGMVEVTGDDILQATALPAGPDRYKAWKRFIIWTQRSPYSFVKELGLQDNDNPRLYSQISIAKPWQKFLAELLQVRDMLTGNDERSLAFREAALARGRLLKDKPEILTAVLAKSKMYAQTHAGAKSWLPEVIDYVPGGSGIAVPDLHRIVTKALGRDIKYKEFQQGLGDLAGIHVTKRQGAGRAGKTVGYVTLRSFFPKDWSDEAACRGYDTELFFPTGTRGPAIAQAEKAKRICHGCPVRLACLKKSARRGGNFGVSGGVWWESPKPDLTEADRKLLPSIVIGRPREPWDAGER